MAGRLIQIVRLAGAGVPSGSSALSIDEAARLSHELMEPNADAYPPTMFELPPRFISPVAASVPLSDLRCL